MVKNISWLRLIAPFLAIGAFFFSITIYLGYAEETAKRREAELIGRLRIQLYQIGYLDAAKGEQNDCQRLLETGNDDRAVRDQAEALLCPSYREGYVDRLSGRLNRYSEMIEPIGRNARINL
jgi:hypothetical protein